MGQLLQNTWHHVGWCEMLRKVNLTFFRWKNSTSPLNSFWMLATKRFVLSNQVECSKMLPHSLTASYKSKYFILGVFMLLTKILSFITIIVSVVVLTIYEGKSDRPVPNILRCILNSITTAEEKKQGRSKTNGQKFNNSSNYESSPTKHECVGKHSTNSDGRQHWSTLYHYSWGWENACSTCLIECRMR